MINVMQYFLNPLISRQQNWIGPSQAAARSPTWPGLLRVFSTRTSLGRAGGQGGDNHDNDDEWKNIFLGHDLIFRFLALRGSEIFIFERPPLTSEVMFQMFIFHQTLKLNDFLKDWSGGEGAGSVLQYKVNMIAMWRRLMWIWDWWSWRQGRQWGWIYQSGHADAAIINIVSSTSLSNNADADVDNASSYWWHCLLQVFEAMFRVIKESEYVDERQHCFLIQVNLTKNGAMDQTTIFDCVNIY